jgi:hypothetical protein
MEAINTELQLAPHEVFDEYFDMLEGTSESPLTYHRWTLISAVAALLGRGAYMQFGHEQVHANMFVCLMGNAGTRKSSAISIGRKLLTSANYNKFARERSSKEKFIKDLGEGFASINRINPAAKKSKSKEALEQLLDEPVEADLIPSEVYICAGELEDFLGQGDGAFISLLTNLWDNLPHYAHGKMTSQDIYIHQPCINLIGGATPTTFNTVFPPEVIGQGMMSRLILVYGAGVHEKLTIPKAPDPAKLGTFQELMCMIARHGHGEYTYDAGAYEILDAVYQSDIDLADFRLESYLNRRFTHWLKLCMVVCALNLTKVVTREIAILANTILHYTERDMPTALGEFGKNTKGDTDSRILNAIDKYHTLEGNENKQLTADVLFKLVRTDYADLMDYSKALMKLTRGGKILVHTTKGMVSNVSGEALKYIKHVDFSLLREQAIRKL